MGIGAFSLHLPPSITIMRNHTRYHFAVAATQQGLEMEEAYVKLRSDLEIHSESNGGVIVKDPVTHGFYRFTPVQASVLERLDGKQDFRSIAASVSSRSSGSRSGSVALPISATTSCLRWPCPGP